MKNKNIKTTNLDKAEPRDFYTKKLNIPKSSRPKPEILDDQTKAYCDAITTKLKNLKPKVIQNFRYSNNLTTDMQKILNKIKELVISKQIVICRADKGGKILIIDYDKYDAIMLQQLKAITTLKDINMNNLVQTLDKVTNCCNNYIIKLHKLNYINNKLLFHTTGLKCKKTHTIKLSALQLRISLAMYQRTPTHYLKRIN